MRSRSERSKCLAALILCVVLLLHEAVGAVGKQPNFLLILADDLGYGDTSVPPFVGSGVRTPHLERMAKNGATLVNYHTAAATCTPTRASILTGLYPWRMGLKAVFEYGQKGSSNRDDWLPRLPTMPAIFAENNYTTFHSGKWHVGGMRNDDFDMRTLPDLGGEQVPGSRRCPHPGPIQQGFQNYVSVLDGPGAPRQNRLQVDATLYRLGCNFLLHNDQPINAQSFNISGYLSYCEAKHAMRVMEDSVRRGIPFYVQVWFHAPHGPWEEIPEFRNWYPDQLRPANIAQAPPCNGNFQPNKQRFCRTGQGRETIFDRGVTRFAMYRTMVSDMDKQVGMLLDFLANLGVDKNTMVIFSSDNGPEDAAGGAGPLRGNKRHIFEGGIRVPAIVQWPGVIPAGSEVSSLVVSTDWMPTLLEAANVSIPGHVLIDGHSQLSELLHATPVLSSSTAGVGASSTQDNSTLSSPMARKAHRFQKHASKRRLRTSERVVLWHNDYEGPRRTAIWAYDFKLILDENELPLFLFDMKTDIAESHNLLEAKSPPEWKQFLSRCAPFAVQGSRLVPAPNKLPASPPIQLTRTVLRTQRGNSSVHQALVCRLYEHMLNFVQRGDEGFRKYHQAYPQLRYPMTPFSDQRPVLGIRVSSQENERLREQLLRTHTCGSAPCGCSWVGASQVPTLPFPAVPTEKRGRTTIAPCPFVNASLLMMM